MDAERHLLGAGFVTLLIFGEGANLLPGFARRPLRHEGFVWATLGLGNCAVLLRVAPLITPGVFQGPAADLALAAAGAVDLLAVCAFAANIGLSGGSQEALSQLLVARFCDLELAEVRVVDRRMTL